MMAPETKRQRLEEAAMAYLARDPAEKLTDFCERLGVGRRTWYTWLAEEPQFRDRIRDIDALRAQWPAQEVFRERVEAVATKVAEDAISAPTARERIMASRLVFEVLGIVGRQSLVSQRVDVAVDAPAAAVAEDIDIEELLKRGMELRRIVNKYVAPHFPQYFPEIYPEGAPAEPDLSAPVAIVEGDGGPVSASQPEAAP